jgi:peptide/nickel transport system permease protein
MTTDTVAPTRSPALAPMLRVLGQTAGVFAVVFVFATFVTFLLQQITGLSPAPLQLGESATPEQVARLEHEWGLDRPFAVQYADWFGGILSGDLGTSWYNGASISALLASRVPISLSVAGLALVIGVVFGFALGALAALRPASVFDRGITAVTTFVSTMPPFVVGIALVAVFAVGFGWFPAAGYVPIARGVDTVSDLARQLRGGLIQAGRENYVTGAILRGFSPHRIFWHHAVRGGAGPALAVLGMKFPALLGGAVVTESIFGLAGFGVFAADSAKRGDVPAVQGVLVVAIVLVVVFNLLVNLLLSRLNPASARGI